MEKKITWINCVKAVAILAVMIDHTAGILYSQRNIQLASFFSVSLFIIVSGMMCYSSDERHELNWYQTFFRSSRGIITAYLIANVVYLVWNTHFFDFSTYVNYVIHFDLSGPFYYVLLYLQLMLVNRFLYNILKKNQGKYSIILDIAIGVVILIICFLTTNYTNILSVYGGGGKVFGGTYLFLFYLGMIITKYELLKNSTLKKSVVLSIVCGGGVDTMVAV